MKQQELKDMPSQGKEGTSDLQLKNIMTKEPEKVELNMVDVISFFFWTCLSISLLSEIGYIKC